MDISNNHFGEKASVAEYVKVRMSQLNVRSVAGIISKRIFFALFSWYSLLKRVKVRQFVQQAAV